MHNILLPDQLEARAKALGWRPGRLAELAGVHRTTFTRAVAGDTGIRLGTLKKLTETLTAHEVALRDHLMALHPVSENGAGAAAEQAEAPSTPLPSPPPQGGREQDAAAGDPLAGEDAEAVA